MKLNQLVLLLLFSLCIPLHGFSAVLVKANFDTGFGPANLAGQPPIPGSLNDIGFTGTYTYSPYSLDVTNGNYLKVVTASGQFDLSYTVANGGKISSGANVVDFKTSASSGWTYAGRSLSTPITGKSFFAAVTIKPLAPSTATSCADLFFTLGSGGGDPFIGICNSKASAGYYAFNAALVASSSTLVTSTTSTYLLAAQYIWNSTSGKYDQIKFWVNPSAGDSNTPSATITNATSTFSSFSSIGLRAINMTPNSEYAFDSLTIGTAWNDVIPVSSATQIDPSTGAAITYENPWFSSSTNFENYCAETFSAVSRSTMASTPGVTILNFEPSNGFAVAAQAINTNGTFFTNTGTISPCVIGNAITSISTSTNSIGVQWRPYNQTNKILGATDPNMGVFLVKDRGTNDTMISGTQGLIAGNLSCATTSSSGGIYLTFDQNLSQFSVVLKTNSTDYSPTDVIALFDKDGVLIARYTIGIGTGQALYFGVKSPTSLIRSVWIGQSTAVNGLVIDDIAFVPGPTIAPTYNFSFAGDNSTTGWSNTTVSLTTSPDHLTLTGNNWDAKIYRSITLQPGATYRISGTGNGQCIVWVGPNNYSAINLASSGTWRSDSQIFTVPASCTASYVTVQVNAGSGSADIQSLTITPETVTPYNYDVAAMQSARPSPAIVRGMMGCEIITQSPGLAYFQDMKKWGANIARLQFFPARYAKGLSQDFMTAWPAFIPIMQQSVLDASQAGLKVVIDLHEAPFTEANSYNGSSGLWHRDDLTQRFCTVWRDIVTALHTQSYASSIWAYEILNEPLDESQLPLPVRQFWSLSESVRKTIRTVDSSVWIIYGVGPGDGFSGFKCALPFPDTHMIYTAHFYYPGKFVGQGITESQSGSAQPAFIHYPGTIDNVYYDKAKLAAYLASADNFAATWKAPIYVGEFSTVRWGPCSDTANWMTDVLDLFETRGWSWSYHAYREWYGWRIDQDATYWKNGDATPPTVTTFDANGIPVNLTDRGSILYNTLLKNNTP